MLSKFAQLHPIESRNGVSLSRSHEALPETLAS